MKVERVTTFADQPCRQSIPALGWHSLQIYTTKVAFALQPDIKKC
ncbi:MULTISPECIES: hypothetical protein [unclassified Spirosoma]|nr:MULTISPECIES: hypothetical protein [unclassified Spirosoma]